MGERLPPRVTTKSSTIQRPVGRGRIETTNRGGSRGRARASRGQGRHCRALGQGRTRRSSPDGLSLVAVPAREDPRDAICGASSLSELPPEARVGTSSLRRAAQVRAVRPDLEVVEVRATSTPGCASSPRVSAMHSCWQWRGWSGSAATVMLSAGTLDEFVPAAGQGALAVEARPGATSVSPVFFSSFLTPTISFVMAERELTRGRWAPRATRRSGAHARVLCWRRGGVDGVGRPARTARCGFAIRCGAAGRGSA